MARKKKKKRDRPTKGKSKESIFNPAINEPIHLSENLSPDRSNGTDPSLQKPPVADENQRLFEEAMADVNPLGTKPNRMIPEPDTNTRPAHAAPDDELETLAHLNDLVSGSTELDITFSDEYIEGAVHGFDSKLMARLKKGEFPLQNHIDLHGLTRREAREKVVQFILESYRSGLRCVLVVHGRGRNSEDHIPVLKERLPYWLTRGPARKIVLAFSTARPYDGGSGAIYILLRKRRGAL